MESIERKKTKIKTEINEKKDDDGNVEPDKIENMRNSKRIGSPYSSMRRRRKSGRVGLFENSRIWNPLHRRISIPQHQLLSCNWHGMRKKPVYIIANKCPAVRRNILRRGVHRCTAIENTDYWCWLWWARNWIQIRYFIIGEQIFVDWLEIWWRRYFRMKVFSTYLT